MSCERSVMVSLSIMGIVLAFAGITPAAMAEPTASATAAPKDMRGVAPLPLSGARRAAFETYVADGLKRFGVPGTSVAVVQGGDVVYLQGFGVKETGRSALVGPDTLFAIASTTKALTSAMAATVVDDGLMSWDTPVQRLLPEFALADTTLASRLTVADAFCMCTGIPDRTPQIIFSLPSLNPQHLIGSVADMPLTAPFGQRFQYSNQMYDVGGYAATVAAGGAPDDLNHAYHLAMRDRLLVPLGMTRSTFSIDRVLADGDYTHPHAADIENRTRPISLLATARLAERGAGPAGALWSSAREMARWLGMQLANGVAPNGRRVVSAANLLRTRAPRVPIKPEPDAPGLINDASRHYAMGWEVGAYKGEPVIHHSGSILGFNSQVTFLPEAGFGVVILTNGGPGAVPFTLAVRFRLLELLFDQPQEYDALAVQRLEAEAKAFAAMRAELRAVDAAAVAPWQGRYTNKAMGEVALVLSDGKLVLDAGAYHSELRAQVDKAKGAVTYGFIDAPLAGPGMFVTLRRDGGGRPEIVLIVKGEVSDAKEASGTPATIYVFRRR
jgi:CubicO group peptidase (beta-lactamase class C family)